MPHYGVIAQNVISSVPLPKRAKAMDIETLNGLSQEPCTNFLFRKHTATYDYFPSGGTWERSHFEPAICKFQVPGYLRLKQCLVKSGLISLVTLGDSQGVRYFKAILKSFKSIASHCKRTKMEHMGDNATIPGTAYFSRGNVTLEESFRVKPRGCRSCVSQEWVCHFMKHHPKLSVRLEYIGMGHVWDESLLIKKTVSGKLKLEYSFASFQEFLFKYYLKAIQPGLILFFAPLNHDKLLQASKISTSFTNLGRVLRENILPAKLYLIGGTSEFENRKADIWANVTFRGLTAADITERQNHMMYSALRKFFVGADRQVYPFVDMMHMSESRGSWSTDGIHFLPVWYKSVTNYLLQLFCNDYL